MIKIVKENAEYYIGTAREIKSLHKNIFWRTSCIPLYANAPKFDMSKVYAIEIVTDRDSVIRGRYWVLEETDVCHLLMGEVA